MEEAQRIARDVYGFEAGEPARNLDETDLKLLGKLDWAIDKKHRASAIYQRTGGNQIQPTTSSDTTLPLSSNWYDARGHAQHDLRPPVLELVGQAVDRGRGERQARVEPRQPAERQQFMQATITTTNDPTTTADDGRIILGPDEFRHNNELDNNVVHAKAEANYLTGTAPVHRRARVRAPVRPQPVRADQLRRGAVRVARRVRDEDAAAAPVLERGDAEPRGRGGEVERGHRHRCTCRTSSSSPATSRSRVASASRSTRPAARSRRTRTSSIATGSSNTATLDRPQHPDAAARHQLPAVRSAQPARRRRALQRRHADGVGVEQLLERRRPASPRGR